MDSECDDCAVSQDLLELDVSAERDSEGEGSLNELDISISIDSDLVDSASEEASGDPILAPHLFLEDSSRAFSFDWPSTGEEEFGDESGGIGMDVIENALLRSAEATDWDRPAFWDTKDLSPLKPKANRWLTSLNELSEIERMEECKGLGDLTNANQSLVSNEMEQWRPPTDEAMANGVVRTMTNDGLQLQPEKERKERIAVDEHDSDDIDEDPEAIFLRPFKLAHQALHSAAPERRVNEIDFGVVRNANNSNERSSGATNGIDAIFGRVSERKTITDFLHNHIANRTGGSLYIAAYKLLFFSVPSLHSVSLTKYLSTHLLTGQKALRQKRSLDAELGLYFQNQPTVLVVDECDQLSSAALLQLFRWPTQPQSRAIVIGVANTIDLPSRHGSPLAALPELPTTVFFDSYTSDQIQHIIAARLSHIAASAPLFDARALSLIAKKTSESGDLRKALDLCVESLQRFFTMRATNTKLTCVTVQCVALAVKETMASRSLAQVAQLSLNQLLILSAILATQEKVKGTDVVLSEVFKEFIALLKAKEFAPLTLTDFLNLCDLLVTQGLLTLVMGNNNNHNGLMVASGKGRGRGRASKAKAKDRQQALFLQLDAHAIVSLNVVEADIRYALKEKEYLSSLL